MLIWFYAPMKPPTHTIPSGDRRVGRLLIKALKRAGHEVRLISRLRSYDGNGDPAKQAMIRKRGRKKAEQLIQKAIDADRPPDLWFTYHLYHKAPDWLGPFVCTKMQIPYVVAEASRAPKRANGPWSIGYEQCEAALAMADTIISLNPADDACVAAALQPNTPIIRLRPFLDPRPFDQAKQARSAWRSYMAAVHGLSPKQPWMVAAAMMRPGDKTESYKVLAKAVRTLNAPLLIAGDGSARSEIEALFNDRSAPTIFLGALDQARLAETYAAADIMIWPAINEAYGMALLEAQAAGCPVVAGRTGGVSEIVEHETSGLLVPVGDATAIETAIRQLLDNPEHRARLSLGATKSIQDYHTMHHASCVLDDVVNRVVCS